MNALQAFAIWLGLVAVFGIFWALMKSGSPAFDDPEDQDPPPPPEPPASGA